MNISSLNSFLEFPANFTEFEKAKAKTLFYKKLALEYHRFFGGKMQSLPKAGIFGFDWFNVWYTPGVSAVSTAIRDNEKLSYELTNRGNSVAIVSDSTRVLGDGNCNPSGGLGVMEGKAMLMKILGSIDAVPLCIDSRDNNGNNCPEKIIDFVKMLQPSFGAVNLEDISQPNCYKVLDELQKSCKIPVWHDDAQGTAAVTLAGLINALKLVNKKKEDVKIVYMGAGASNTAIVRINITAGFNPDRMIMFDSKGALSKNREDIKSNKALYRKWEICEATNPARINNIEAAVKNTDTIISLSKQGPDVIKPEWIRSMGEKPIVFACANPIPEIYPDTAKKAGAFIVATGRGDFPNQINNSLGFPGILKGTLIVRASKITDTMVISASEALAEYAENRGITPENIIPKMDESDVFIKEAAAVAMKAIEEGLAQIQLTRAEVEKRVKSEITLSQQTEKMFRDTQIIKSPDAGIIKSIFKEVVAEIRANS